MEQHVHGPVEPLSEGKTELLDALVTHAVDVEVLVDMQFVEEDDKDLGYREKGGTMI